MTDREVMQQALGALEQYTDVVTSVNDPNSWVTVADGGKPARDAITTLRAAIEQAQEPVAWMHPDWRTYTRAPAVSITPKEGWHPLYTAPPQRKPLTDEEIERACVPLGAAMLSFTAVARAIEAAHGIKG